MESNNEILSPAGSIKIAEDVVSVIAGIAVSEIKGIYSVGNESSAITELLGRKNISKSAEVIIENDEVTINIEIVTEYGVKIPALAKEVQLKVKEAVETMVGLAVRAVNVNVHGIHFQSGSELNKKK